MINATLVVQIINFIVAYYIIERLLLRPVVAIIHDSRQKESELNRVLEHERKALKDAVDYKNVVWEKTKNDLRARMPELIDQVLSQDVQQADAHYEISYTKQRMSDYRSVLREYLIKKVGS